MAQEENKPDSGGEESRLKVRYIEQQEPLAFFRFQETPLREVVEELPDGYYETNLRGDLIAFNRALCRIHGYSPEEMINMNFREYTPKEKQESILRTYQDVYNTGQPVEILDFQVTRPDGSVCVIHTSAYLVRDHDGNPTGFRGISRDVTEQKRSEAYERARTQVLEGIARNAPLEETLRAILGSLWEQMPDCPGMILQDRDGLLECVASQGLSREIVSNVDGEKVGSGEGIGSRAAFLREPVIIQDVRRDSRCDALREDLLAQVIEAVWAYPVLGREGSLLGVLALYPASARAPSEREQEWLQSATATAEIAFTHHRVTSELDYLSRHDPLTGTLNRRSFLTESERMIALSRRKGWNLGILFLDLDRFKPVNDTWGHQIGDLLLKEVAERLESSLRRSDILARLGGDEFAVLVPEAGTDEARVIANRIVQAVTEPFDMDGTQVCMGISAGIALASPEEQVSADTLLMRADSAMYHAKTQGAGWAFHEPKQHREAQERARTESHLRQALAREEMLLYYQPIRELKSGRWVGAEALVRWKHPENGVIAAADFLPLAEGRGLIREIDRYVLPRALEETRDWPGWISVNVSPLSLCHPDWPSYVRDCLNEQGFPPERLVLEVTERILLDMDSASEVLQELKDMGVGIALDDFGTGYSSLGYLAQFAVHSLKMDRGFMGALESDERNQTLARTILALAENLDIPVVAEGVETEGDLGWLSRHGCALAQGFFLARPAAWGDLHL